MAAHEVSLSGLVRVAGGFVVPVPRLSIDKIIHCVPQAAGLGVQLKWAITAGDAVVELLDQQLRRASLVCQDFCPVICRRNLTSSAQRLQQPASTDLQDVEPAAKWQFDWVVTVGCKAHTFGCRTAYRLGGLAGDLTDEAAATVPLYCQYSTMDVKPAAPPSGQQQQQQQQQQQSGQQSGQHQQSGQQSGQHQQSGQQIEQQQQRQQQQQQSGQQSGQQSRQQQQQQQQSGQQQSGQQAQQQVCQQLGGPGHHQHGLLQLQQQQRQGDQQEQQQRQPEAQQQAELHEDSLAAQTAAASQPVAVGLAQNSSHEQTRLAVPLPEPIEVPGATLMQAAGPSGAGTAPGQASTAASPLQQQQSDLLPQPIDHQGAAAASQPSQGSAAYKQPQRRFVRGSHGADEPVCAPTAHEHLLHYRSTAAKREEEIGFFANHPTVKPSSRHHQAVALVSPTKASTSNRANVPNLGMLRHYKAKGLEAWQRDKDIVHGILRIAEESAAADANRLALANHPVGYGANAGRSTLHGALHYLQTRPFSVVAARKEGIMAAAQMIKAGGPLCIDLSNTMAMVEGRPCRSIFITTPNVSKPAGTDTSVSNSPLLAAMLITVLATAAALQEFLCRLKTWFRDLAGLGAVPVVMGDCAAENSIAVLGAFGSGITVSTYVVVLESLLLMGRPIPSDLVAYLYDTAHSTHALAMQLKGTSQLPDSMPAGSRQAVSYFTFTLFKDLRDTTDILRAYHLMAMCSTVLTTDEWPLATQCIPIAAEAPSRVLKYLSDNVLPSPWMATMEDDKELSASDLQQMSAVLAAQQDESAAAGPLDYAAMYERLAEINAAKAAGVTSFDDAVPVPAPPFKKDAYTGLQLTITFKELSEDLQVLIRQLDTPDQCSYKVTLMPWRVSVVVRGAASAGGGHTLPNPFRALQLHGYLSDTWFGSIIFWTHIHPRRRGEFMRSGVYVEGKIGLYKHAEGLHGCCTGNDPQSEILMLVGNSHPSITLPALREGYLLRDAKRFQDSARLNGAGSAARQLHGLPSLKHDSRTAAANPEAHWHRAGYTPQQQQLTVRWSQAFEQCAKHHKRRRTTVNVLTKTYLLDKKRAVDRDSALYLAAEFMAAYVAAEQQAAGTSAQRKVQVASLWSKINSTSVKEWLDPNNRSRKFPGLHVAAAMTLWAEAVLAVQELDNMEVMRSTMASGVQQAYEHVQAVLDGDGTTAQLRLQQQHQEASQGQTQQPPGPQQMFQMPSHTQLTFDGAAAAFAVTPPPGAAAAAAAAAAAQPSAALVAAAPGLFSIATAAAPAGAPFGSFGAANFGAKWVQLCQCPLLERALVHKGALAVLSSYSNGRAQL